MKIEDFPALKSLNETQFENLRNASSQLDAVVGKELMKRGEEGGDLYLLLEGELSVYIPNGEREIELVRLVAPAVVGELELLTGEPRSASVRVTRDAKLLVLPHDKLEARINDGDPAVLKVMVQISRLIAGRLASMTEKFVELESSVEPSKSHELSDFRKKLFSEWSF
jgi:CRP-like cAMP-binding protein